LSPSSGDQQLPWFLHVGPPRGNRSQSKRDDTT
jgi:hypothetical protein